MQIIPVLDLLGGRAVHARGGRRDDYRPLRSVLRPDSDPISVASAVRDHFGFRAVYVADLDAIAGGAPAFDLYAKLLAIGLEPWVDAGVRDRGSAVPIAATGISRVVVGLETLAGPRTLSDLLEEIGPDRTVFSLDLREGRPIIAHAAHWPTSDPIEIAEIAVDLGVSTVIVLDLARVGRGEGVGSLPMLRTLVDRFPQIAWIPGGGVAGREDLEILARLGASAVLVASALHDGRIRPEDLREIS